MDCLIHFQLFLTLSVWNLCFLGDCLGHCEVSSGLWHWLIFIFACTSTIFSIYELLHLSMLYSKNAATTHFTIWILHGFSWHLCDVNVKIALQMLKPFFAGYQSILFSVLNSWGSVDCNLSEILLGGWQNSNWIFSWEANCCCLFANSCPTLLWPHGL